MPMTAVVRAQLRSGSPGPANDEHVHVQPWYTIMTRKPAHGQSALLMR